METSPKRVSGERLSEKIARQIARIAQESVRVDAEILKFLKEDFDEIRQKARSEGIGYADLLKEILLGIEKGLVEGGVQSVAELKRILGRSEKALDRLEESWHPDDRKEL